MTRTARILAARDLFRALEALSVGESLTLPNGETVTAVPASKGGGVVDRLGQNLSPWHLATGLYRVNTTIVPK